MRKRVSRFCNLVVPALLFVGVAPSPTWTPLAAAEPPTIERIRLVRERLTGQPLGMTGLEIVPASLDTVRLADTILVDAFPLPERRPVGLELHAVRIVNPDSRFVVVDENGERDVAPPDIRFLRGRVEGVEDSSVAMIAFADGISGSVRLHGESFGFGSRWPGANARASHDLRVWNHDLEDMKPPISCDTDGPSGRRSPSRPSVDKGLAVDDDALIEATLAVDATVQWYERLGSVEAAQLHILELIHQTSSIYEAEVGVRLSVGYLRIFTAEPDPYDGSNGTLALLGQLRNEWNANQSDVDRALVHLFDIQEGNGGAGRAFVNVLCDNTDQPGASVDYGLSRIQAESRVWELRMVAHELGHGFASQHTHCYEPEIDRCASSSGCYAGTPQASQGTIMSYCNQYEVTFHQRVRDEAIRPAAEAALDGCLTLADRPGAIPAEGGATAAALMLTRPSRGGSDAVVMTWGEPCNSDSVADQDYAIYHAPLGEWSSATPLTCSTSRARSWSELVPDGYFLVVPGTPFHEGSYGRTSDGIERAPSASACLPQAIGSCF